MPWIVLIAGLVLSQNAPRTADPFSGTWVANLTKSKVQPGSQVQSETLQFVFAAQTVRITDHVITATGQDLGYGTTTFQVDGQPHPHDELLPGAVVVVRWRGALVLEMVWTRSDGQVDRVTYEVSRDGRTLTTRTSGSLGDQTVVFERGPQ